MGIKNFNWLDQLQDTTLDFSKYIETFSTATYTIEFSNAQPVVATVSNLFEKLNLVGDFKERGTSFFRYNIKDGELPEDVAIAVYGSKDFWWVPLIFNGITNAFTQWPMRDEAIHYLTDELVTIEDKYSRSAYYDLLFEQNEKMRAIDVLKPEQLSDLIFQYQENIATEGSTSASSLNKQFTIIL